MSSSLVLPVLIASAFASGSLATKGLVNPLGTVTNGVLSSSASLSPGASLVDGLPLVTMTNPLAGGVAPAGADFNGILNYITAFQAWSNAGGQYPFSATLAAAIGGYPLGAVLQLNTGLGSVVSTISGNTQDPNVAMTGWAPYGGAFTSGQVLVGSGTGTVSSTGLTYSSAAGLGVVSNANITSANVNGTTTTTTTTATAASSYGVNGLAATVNYTGAYSLTSTSSLVGLAGIVNVANTAGTVQQAVGLTCAVTQTGAGTTTNLSGIVSGVFKTAGTVTNAYGLYINTVTAGANNYAIFTNSGVVSIGDTTASSSTTTGALVVAGGVGVGGMLTLGGTQNTTLKFSTCQANGTGACAFNSGVAPAGAGGSIYGWIPVNIGGTMRFIPCF